MFKTIFPLCKQNFYLRRDLHCVDKISMLKQILYFEREIFIYFEHKKFYLSTQKHLPNR